MTEFEKFLDQEICANYWLKGLKTPKFNLNSKVTPVTDYIPGRILEIDTTEKFCSGDEQIEWRFLVHFGKGCPKEFSEHQLKLIEVN